MATTQFISRFRLLVFAYTFPLVVSFASFAQTGVWNSHTSFKEVLAVDFAPDRLWAASTGGVFSIDRQTGEIDRFTIVDGLHAVSSQALAFDSGRNVVWLGYVDGVLDRIDTESGTIESFRDIERADQFATRGINRILVAGDSLLIATDFGVVVFDPVLNEVRDSYTRLGALPPATKVNSISVSGAPLNRLAVATVEGLAFAQTDAVNLQDPLSWSVESVNDGEVTAVAEFNGLIYAGTDEGLFVRNAQDDYSFVDVSSRRITQLFATQTILYGSERFRIFGIFPEGAKSFISETFFEPVDIRIEGQQLLVADLTDGLVVADVPEFSNTNVDVVEVIVPEGPTDGIFSDISIAPDGTLLAGGSPKPTSGFYSLSPAGVWTSFTGIDLPPIAGTSRYTRVHQDATGAIWAASEGGGVAQVTTDGSVTLFNEDNSTLLSATGFPGFIIAGGVTTDRDNNLWVTTRGSTQPLHIRQPDGNWTGRGPLIGDGLTSNSTAFDRIYNDSFNQKWIIVRDATAFNIPLGVLVLDDAGTAVESSDDFFRFFRQRGSAGQGLPSNRVTSVTEDKNGLIWVGTEEGPAYFVNTGIVARDASATPIWPQLADRSEGIFLYFGLPINDIAVDPANRLWFATNEGVRVVRELEGGYEEIAHLTTENAPLPSNIIVSIAVRESTGEVFIATERGMVSTITDAIEPATSVRDLTVYPNPVHLTGRESAEISIEGLTDETILRIASVDGRVLREYKTRGGRVQWDGKDSTGKFVPSGMYLIIAVSERGDKTAFGKVAVIN